jgi:hypothetical protein
MSDCIVSAYGREAVTRCWARRIREAATISIALVICDVLLIDRMRRRMSRRLGIDAIPLQRD